MEGVEIQPHIRLSKKNVTPIVLVVGDPARAETIAKLCQAYNELASNREYRSFECIYDGAKFLVVSHGVGSAGAAICFEELINCGAKVIIRAGTAGSLQDSFAQGDLCIVQAAVRDEGLSMQFVPKVFPAVTDIDIYNKLVETAKEMNISYQAGYALTSDSFYPSKKVDEKLHLYRDAGVSIVEMEIAALFIVGKLKKIKTGALCVVDGSPINRQTLTTDNYDPTGERVKAGKDKMLQIAIKTCVKLAKEHLQ